MDKLLLKQSAILDDIGIIKRNFNKTGNERRTRGYVSAKLDTVRKLWETFNHNHALLSVMSEFAKSEYATEHVYDEAEEEYSIFVGTLSDIIHNLDQAEHRANIQQQVPPPPIPNQQLHSPSTRLPQINLPTFSGEYESWTAFHDMFASLIHNNASLTDVQKLHYLKSNLRGEASNLLRHTQITAQNYAIAWDALKARYENKRILVNAQLKTFFHHPSQRDETARGIREIIDMSQDCMNALRVLQVDTDNWDPLLLFILIQKVSSETHVAWELDQEGVTELPTYNAFIEFMENRFRMRESLATRTPSHVRQPSSRQVKSHVAIGAAPHTPPCPICSEQHYVRACPTFNQMSINDRRNTVKNSRICFNCLTPGHMITECRNRRNCQTCNKRHHTLLHDPNTTTHHHSSSPTQSPSTPGPSTSSATPAPTSSQSSNSPINGNAPVSTHMAAASISPSSPAHVLLATAIVIAVSSTGSHIPMRALVDQGSQVTFITENAMQLLRLNSSQSKPDWSLTGIGCTSAGRIRHAVSLQLRSSHQADFTIQLNAFVLKSITGMLPPSRCSTQPWPHISNITLADPTYNIPGAIDILLGADAYANIIQSGLLRGPAGTPIAQKTVFGWILSGQAPSSEHDSEIQSHLCTFHTCIEIDDRLKSFWELEHNASTINTIYTDEEMQCEKHYEDTHTKSSDGRYIVRLPLRKNMNLGQSRSTALHRFLQVERRLQQNSSLRASYTEFMNEYLALGHMQVSRTSHTQELHYFIPHHAVFKDSSTTTKVRVVFDASCKSSNGVALNELMLIGPKLQDDLSVILLRWRKFPIAFTADVEKMYRQILVHPDDQPLQHILWRANPNEPIVEYALNTVTYGTSCAPHLAVRTLRQLSTDFESTHPVAAKMVREDFYVDDLMSGAYIPSDAIIIRRQLCDLMSAGGLKLRKWVSNYAPLLDDIPSIDRELQNPRHIDINNTVTALGIIWNPSTDKFHFRLTLSDTESPPTKRNVLSDISKLFDPLGWIAPAIIRSKLLMQRLWLQGVTWDEPLSQPLASQWLTLRKDLFNVSKITIDRWIRHNNNAIELHGFSDASSYAYAAAIYVRIMLPDGTSHVDLLTAKTRVAPLKQVSIPRLELCGAVLVAELLQKTRAQLNIDDITIHAWTDSSIVLHWIHAQPCRWKTFVANRVATIQQLTPMSNWHHVPTNDNPADCASRGMEIETLQTFSLWWHGPSWLAQSPESWPAQKIVPTTEYDNQLEQRILSNVAEMSKSSPSFSIILLQSISSLDRLLKVFAYCKRFLTRHKQTLPNHRTVSASELNQAMIYFIKISQSDAFQHEITALKLTKALSPRSKIKSLNPYIDQDGILRVGGRLKNANLSHDEKHPIILHHKCHLTALIIRKQHFATMHGGASLMLGLIRKSYWIINARDTVRQYIHRCITCHRFNAVNATQLMADLPPPRVNISRAFTHTGVDYAGPIDLRMSKGRGNASYKGYISLFVCLCTKAVHIEAVSDLSSSGFIAAYRRFVARRGLPAHMYSDNGTNFIGAHKTLRKMHDDILLKIKSDIINEITTHNTEWHFIPPSSPHFGGLWEAGVKSMKYHLKRTIGTTKLTYEELSTMLSQIEACLNSRPLTQLSSDPEDFTALTPGHFLTGNALLAAPDISMESTNVSLLTRWQLVQRLYQNITSRWRSEYLARLQQRPKWTKMTSNLKIGDLVLLKDPILSPSHWHLARITKTHPGEDNLVRVVTVRTAKSEFKRCITKICPLPN